MELLIMWIGTVLASFGMELVNEMRMFKDAADNGYKIDIKKLAEFGEQMNPNGKKFSYIQFLIPILNFAGVIQRTMQYNNVRPMILTQLDIMDSLIEMTKDEVAQYQANPTGLNALILTVKAGIQDGKTISFNDGNGKSSITYKIDGNGVITIVKAEGPVARLSVMEQKVKIDEIMYNMAKSIRERYTEEELKEVVNKGLSEKDNFTLDLDAVPVKEEIVKPSPIESTELSISEQRQQLENMKSDLLSQQKQETIQSEKMGHSKVLKK